MTAHTHKEFKTIYRQRYGEESSTVSEPGELSARDSICNCARALLIESNIIPDKDDLQNYIVSGDHGLFCRGGLYFDLDSFLQKHFPVAPDRVSNKRASV